MASFAKLLVLLLATTPITSFVLLSPQVITRHARMMVLLSGVQEENEEGFSIVVEDASSNPKKIEYAALSPGCALKIQVGNVALARKAWKKRRRSGSPLLVPCSVLDVDRKNMVRWNILYLLQKFGTPITELPNDTSIGFLSDDICLSMGELNKVYKSHLGAALAKHAKALGHDTARSLVRDLFNRQAQKELGVRLWLSPKENDAENDESRPMWLLAPLSKNRARRMASQAGLLQFTNYSEDESRMRHTGILRIRNKAIEKSPHMSLPLSAALRVSQRAVDQGVVQDGSIHTAVVFSLDATGDGGAPLFTLALNPTRGQVRNRLKLKAAGKRHFSQDRRVDIVHDVERELKDLKVGDGPYKAKVIRLSTRSGAAFVDVGVGRPVGKQKGGGMARVLGMLRFDDLVKATLSDDEASMELWDVKSTMSDEEAQLIEESMLYEGDWDDDDEDEEDDDDDNIMTVEDLFEIGHDEYNEEDEDEDDWAEEEMDITHLVRTEDGVMSYKDPDTGETIVLSEVEHDADEEDDSDDDNEDEVDEDLFKNMSPDARLDMISKIMNDREKQEDDEEISDKESFEEDEDDVDLDVGKSFAIPSTRDSFQPAFVTVGDEVEVYIKSVFKQSGRFMVTLDASSVKGRKAKDIKKETDAEKKLARLVEQVDGGMQRILDLKGTECDGVVQATSKAGDWCYVQPNIDDLPVGVAKLQQEGHTSISKGDKVRVRMDGIDETRGQLAMAIISSYESH